MLFLLLRNETLLVSHDTFEHQHSVDVPGICDAICCDWNPFPLSGCFYLFYGSPPSDLRSDSFTLFDGNKLVAATTFPSWGSRCGGGPKNLQACRYLFAPPGIGTLSGTGPLADSLLAKVPFNMQAFFHQVRRGRLTLVGRRHGGEPPRKCDKCGEVETVDHWLKCVVDPPQRLESFFDVNLLVIRTCFEAWECRVQQWCENPSRW